MSLKRKASDEALGDSTDSTDMPRQRRRLSAPPQDAKPPLRLPLPKRNAPARTPPSFQMPYQLLSFSYTPERELVFDDSVRLHVSIGLFSCLVQALRYYVDPPPKADLTYRYG